MNINYTPIKRNSKLVVTNGTAPAKATATAMRVHDVPRMSVKRRAAANPHRRFCTPDRFIPNRSRMDTSRARASLMQHTPQASNSATAASSHYEGQLRRALFGTAEKETPIMAFGPKPAKRSKITPTRLFVESNDPYRQDILRSPAMPSGEQQRPHRVAMKRELALDAPRMLQNENLTLFGQGEDSFAVALNDKVYLRNGDGIELLAEEEGISFSCVQWSNDSKLLALGTEGGILVFCPQQDKVTPVFELFEAHSGYVTAITWNGMELVAACRNGITRYDLRKQEPLQATYIGHGAKYIVSLQWSGNTIASASHGEIKLWDSFKSGDNIQPRATMEHAGVNSLEVNPRQLNVLVSAGDGGLKFWNMWTGRLRGDITMETTATKTVCSTQWNEILVAHGNVLSLWSLGPKVVKMMEYCTGIGRITGLQRGLDGIIICAHEDETLTFNALQREISKEEARVVASTGLLKMPTLR